MTSTTPIVRRSVAVLVAGAFLLTGCGSSGGSDSSKDDTSTTQKTTTTAEKTTTTADDTATTAAGDVPTTADLDGILPAAEELGEGWVIDDSEKGPELAIETATEQDCPGAAALLAPAEDDEATRGFLGPNTETVRVTLTGGVERLDADDVQEAVDSINDCDAVTAEDEGITYTASFDASTNDQYGDGGIELAVAVNITDGTDSYDVTKYRVVFTIGQVGVVITGGDGLADDGTITPIDAAGLDAVATEMATRAEAL